MKSWFRSTHSLKCVIVALAILIAPSIAGATPVSVEVVHHPSGPRAALWSAIIYWFDIDPFGTNLYDPDNGFLNLTLNVYNDAGDYIGSATATSSDLMAGTPTAGGFTLGGHILYTLYLAGGVLSVEQTYLNQLFYPDDPYAPNSQTGTIATGLRNNLWGDTDGTMDPSEWATDIMFETTPATVPEPASLLLFGSGLLGIGAWGRNRKNRPRS